MSRTLDPMSTELGATQVCDTKHFLHDAFVSSTLHYKQVTDLRITTLYKTMNNYNDLDYPLILIETT